MLPQGWSDIPTTLQQCLQSPHQENCLHLLKCEAQSKILPLDLQVLTIHTWVEMVVTLKYTCKNIWTSENFELD